MKRRRSHPTTTPIKGNRQLLVELMQKLYKPKKGATLSIWAMTESQAGVVLAEILKSIEADGGDANA